MAGLRPSRDRSRRSLRAIRPWPDGSSSSPDNPLNHIDARRGQSSCILSFTPVVGSQRERGAVSPMDQMIDHPTIERTSSERTGGLRQRRPAARTWMVGAAAAFTLLLAYLGSSYYQRGQATAPPATVASVNG